MDYSTGKLAFIFMMAVLLSCGAAWAVAWRYRVTMRRLMSAPRGAARMVAAAAPIPAERGRQPSPAAATLADNRTAALCLTLLLIALSCLMALTGAALWHALSFESGERLVPKRIAVQALVQVWPVIPALGLLWRWSRWRVFATLALWCGLCFAVMLWRSIEPRPLQVLLYLAIEIGPPLVMVTLLCLGNATRAVAPWLLPPFVALVWASVVGADVLAALVAERAALLMPLTSWFGVNGVLLMFVLLPWLLAWWPVLRLGRALGRAYARKQLSELMVLFTAVWAISLLTQALTVASSAGLAGLAMLLPLLWVPLVVLAVAHLRKPPARPPTLLVLRVFQRDAQVQDLFDRVVERWRLSGNTVLIAGTDLVDRTMDAEDILTFLAGDMGQRFIQIPTDVAPRLAAFDMEPDLDGRFRVNECYCHDTTWQNALQALVQRSDVVLMDLRSFQAHNAGCQYELSALATSPQPLRVIVLTDGQTDRAAATESVAEAPADRFEWIDTSRIDDRKRQEVLARLFVA